MTLETNTLIFRNHSHFWAVIANELAIAINLNDPELVALLTVANEAEFVNVQLNSRSMQIYGLYTGESKKIKTKTMFYFHF